MRRSLAWFCTSGSESWQCIRLVVGNSRALEALPPKIYLPWESVGKFWARDYSIQTQHMQIYIIRNAISDDSCSKTCLLR